MRHSDDLKVIFSSSSGVIEHVVLRRLCVVQEITLTLTAPHMHGAVYRHAYFPFQVIDDVQMSVNEIFSLRVKQNTFN